MVRLWRVSLSVLGLTLLALLGSPRLARAEQPGPNATPLLVLGIDTEDVEDQADALAGAIRSRIIREPGWSLVETNQSLSMITAALKCPARPDAACQTKISDLLKADRYVWGAMSKAPGDQVAIELHLYTRGKPDSVAKETYSDNLKDQNDETLRKIAGRLLDRVAGATTGIAIVKVGDASGELVIDGVKRVPLDHGAARVELPAGSHVFEVTIPGFSPAKQTATVPPGREVSVAMSLAVEQPVVEKPFPVRKVVAWGVVATGVGLGIGSALFAGSYFSAKSNQSAELALVPRGANVCDQATQDNLQTGGAAAEAACKNNDKAKVAGPLAWAFGGVAAAALGVGVYLLVTDPGAGPDTKAARGPKDLRVSPFVGSANGLVVSGAF